MIKNIFLLLEILLGCTDLVTSVPIIYPPQPYKFFVPKDFCLLPAEFGRQGSIKYLEECDSLDRYPTLPMPAPFNSKTGTHPMVCCPKKIYPDHICLPTDAWCPVFKPVVVDKPKDDPDKTYEPGAIYVVKQPTIANKTCFDTPLGNGMFLNTCVRINQCPGLIALAPSNAPQLVMQPCGFDEELKGLMICCPDSLIVEEPKEETQLPRFPKPDGSPRDCTDKHELCPKWKQNNGCDLDKDFPLTDDPNANVISKQMFDFMQMTCLGSCDLCGSKGCVDEHPSCQVWARNGMCVVNPLVMAFTCRESCGVCGFMSPFNNEEQIVGDNSYTDFTKDNFDCGRFKQLTELYPEEGLGDETTTIANEDESVTEDEMYSDYDLDLRSTGRSPSDDVFFSSQGLPSLKGGKPDFFCGATMVTDRWVVAAAHCYDEFGVSAESGPKQVKINTIRDNIQYKEIIEIKRIYKHPLYKYPNLYNDIAVLELGRRIEYNWDKIGDSPTCIDRGLPKVGKIATIQGFGLTENGTRGNLLETNVTIITNNDCKNILKHNLTENANAKGQVDKALPQGLNYGLLCAMGYKNHGVITGSCKGDSGGPLFTANGKGGQTLVGIVSGGVGCGKGYPGWYTKVEFFADWIQCIIETGRNAQGRSQQEILDACESYVVQPKQCKELTYDEILFGDIQENDEDTQYCERFNEYEFLFGGLDIEDTLFGDLRSAIGNSVEEK